MSNDFQSSSRSQYRSKRKKTNLILNGLIVVVLLLIAFVAYSIFSSGSDKAASKKNTEKTASVHTGAAQKNKDNSKKQSSKSETAKKDTESDSNKDSSTSDSSPASGSADNSQAVVTEGGSSPNAEQTIENPDWKPVGTTQEGQHTAVYDSSSADWQEMLKAISYATGLDQGNMTVWFLGRDRSTENGSVGTVSSKDKQQKFRVYLQWVDGQGWKPTKMEQLSEVNQDH